MRHLLTKGTANRILRLKTGQILLKTAQLTHENLSFSTHQVFKCPSNWKIKPNERALLVAGGFQQHPQWLHTKPCLLQTVKDMLGPGRERGHQNSLKILKKIKETCTTFSQKEKGFQAKRVALPSESHWQFLQRSSPRWNWSIYTVLSRLKAPDKRYWNDSTSEQWSAKPACSRPESPRAWQVLLCGCQQILKVVGCRVQHSWRLLCTAALPANPPCWAEQELQLSLAQRGFHTSQGLQVMQLLS